MGELNQLARQGSGGLSVNRRSHPGLWNQLMVCVQGDSLGEGQDRGSNGDRLDDSGYPHYAVGLDLRRAPRIWLGERRHHGLLRGGLHRFLFPTVE